MFITDQTTLKVGISLDQFDRHIITGLGRIGFPRNGHKANGYAKKGDPGIVPVAMFGKRRAGLSCWIVSVAGDKN